MINKKSYLLSTGLFAVLSAVIMKKLDTGLREYEANLPDNYAEIIYRYFFADDPCTSFLELSSGLSDDKKYLVLYKDSPIAVFTIEPNHQTEKTAVKWRLKKIEMQSPCVIEPSDASHMSDDQKAAAFGTLRSRAEYMIHAKGSSEALTSYYDKDAAAYSELQEIGEELWMNEDEGHTFHSESLSLYISYSAHLFSVRGCSTMNVYCSNDDSYRDFAMDITMFFYKKHNQWLCFETTNVSHME